MHLSLALNTISLGVMFVSLLSLYCTSGNRDLHLTGENLGLYKADFSE